MPNELKATESPDDYLFLCELLGPRINYQHGDQPPKFNQILIAVQELLNELDEKTEKYEMLKGNIQKLFDFS